MDELRHSKESPDVAELLLSEIDRMPQLSRTGEWAKAICLGVLGQSERAKAVWQGLVETGDEEDRWEAEFMLAMNESGQAAVQVLEAKSLPSFEETREAVADLYRRAAIAALKCMYSLMYDEMSTALAAVQRLSVSMDQDPKRWRRVIGLDERERILDSLTVPLVMLLDQVTFRSASSSLDGGLITPDVVSLARRMLRRNDLRLRDRFRLQTFLESVEAESK
ncbi:MAG: hypothetical protein AB1725_09210 [Armatimonadota bacterium]